MNIEAIFTYPDEVFVKSWTEILNSLLHIALWSMSKVIWDIH
jgi:hypothetical protein